MRTPGALFAEATDNEDFMVPAGKTASSSPTENLIDEAIESDVEEAEEESATAEDDPYAIEGEDKGISIVAKIAKRMNRKSTEQKVVVWAPLIFPAVPKKGDFDVERVRSSTYFFA